MQSMPLQLRYRESLGASVRSWAVYFTEYDGRRGAIMIVDVADPSKVTTLAEPAVVPVLQRRRDVSHRDEPGRTGPRGRRCDRQEMGVELARQLAPAEGRVRSEAMGDGVPTSGRRPSLGEEIANCVSHGVGALAALVAAPFLVQSAVRRG